MSDKTLPVMLSPEERAELRNAIRIVRRLPMTTDRLRALARAYDKLTSADPLRVPRMGLIGDEEQRAVTKAVLALGDLHAAPGLGLVP